MPVTACAAVLRFSGERSPHVAMAAHNGTTIQNNDCGNFNLSVCRIGLMHTAEERDDATVFLEMLTLRLWCTQGYVIE